MNGLESCQIKHSWKSGRGTYMGVATEQRHGRNTAYEKNWILRGNSSTTAVLSGKAIEREERNDVYEID